MGVLASVRSWFAQFLKSLGSIYSYLIDMASCRNMKKWRIAIIKLDAYLKESGMNAEVSDSINCRFLSNLIILGRIREKLHPDRREEAKISNEDEKEKKLTVPTVEEARRVMHFATSVYGPTMIDAAKVESEERAILTLDTKQKVLEHVGLEEKDVLVANVEYGGSMDCLRHMVAVDHKHKAIILAIRGTLSLSGIVIDISGYSKEFCGGEAHAGIAEIAEAVWNKANASVRDRLSEVPEDYEVIITGHSLGAGVACLITVLVCQDNRKLVDGRRVRCFAFAPPPVFYPLKAAQEAADCTTTYVRETDWVPFLSGDAVRRLLSVLVALDERTRKMSCLSCLRLKYGWSEPDEELLEVVKDAEQKELPLKKGMPELVAPASCIVWMKEDKDTGEFNAVLCDPLLVRKLGLSIEPDMVANHNPPMYERALKYLREDHQ